MAIIFMKCVLKIFILTIIIFNFTIAIALTQGAEEFSHDVQCVGLSAKDTRIELELSLMKHELILGKNAFPISFLGYSTEKGLWVVVQGSKDTIAYSIILTLRGSHGELHVIKNNELSSQTLLICKDIE